MRTSVFHHIKLSKPKNSSMQYVRTNFMRTTFQKYTFNYYLLNNYISTFAFGVPLLNLITDIFLIPNFLSFKKSLKLSALNGKY